MTHALLPAQMQSINYPAERRHIDMLQFEHQEKGSIACKLTWQQLPGNPRSGDPDAADIPATAPEHAQVTLKPSMLDQTDHCLISLQMNLTREEHSRNKCMHGHIIML